MSVLLLAIGTTRARAVCGTAEFLLARDVEVGLVTVDPADWAREGLPDGVRVYALGEGEQRHPLARLGRLVRRLSGAAGRIYAKFYRLLRPYVMWRVARAGAVKRVDWAAVEQLVICDSHAIPIGWHLAKRHPKLTVGFELDRAPYPEREPAQTAPAATALAAAATAAPPPHPARPESMSMLDTQSPPRTVAGPLEHYVFRSRRSGVPRLRDYLPELWERREFVYELARCTLRGQNYLNAFGQLWLILNPLLMGFVYYMLVDILSNGSHASNYFSVLLAGLFLYTFFSSILSQSAGSIIGSSRLVLNSRLPRLVLPITQIVIAFMRFLPCLIVFLAVHTIQNLSWGVAAFYAVPAFLEVAMFGAGLGFICATLQVYFRDFSNFLPYVTRIWMFLSPVLWELQTQLDKHDLKAHVIALNPIAPMIGAWGDALVYNVAPPATWLLEGAGWAVVALVGGVFIFIRREREFSVRL